MKLRLISRVIVLVLVILVGTLIVVRSRADAGPRTPTSTPAPRPSGADLGAVPAPEFTLTDASGAALTLSNLRGHLVVLTFPYTHCREECPLTAEKLHAAMGAPGARAATSVDWLVVSVDLAGDSPAAAHHTGGVVHYLLGTQQQLKPVWDAYHISVQPGSDATAQMGSVSHTIGVYILDARGDARIYLDDTFSPQTLATDLHVFGVRSG